jgi:pheromone shutdown protein TraB
LLNTYKIFNEVIDKRENAMIQNIYNYSKENQYNRAVFLLGAGHRKSIIKKILQCEKQSEIKLNWTIFNDK